MTLRDWKADRHSAWAMKPYGSRVKSVLTDMPIVAHSHFPCLPQGTKRTPSYHLLPTQSHFCKLLGDLKRFFSAIFSCLFMRRPEISWQASLYWYDKQWMKRSHHFAASVPWKCSFQYVNWIWVAVGRGNGFLCAGRVRLITGTTQLLCRIHGCLFRNVSPHPTITIFYPYNLPWVKYPFVFNMEWYLFSEHSGNFHL